MAFGGIMLRGLLLGAMLTSTVALAGTRVGNGGAGWLCRNHGTMTPRWLKLVDLFEADAEYGLQVLPMTESDPWRILEAKLEFIRLHVPRLALTVDRHYLEQAIHELPIGTELAIIHDGVIRVRPSPTTCIDGYLYYFQLANFTDDGRLLLNGEMWNSPVFQSLDRGALLVHEIVYKSLRDHDGDKDSTRARAIVGLLFSNLEMTELNTRIEAILNTPANEFNPAKL